MAIQINGTSGISGVDGSAATPALQGTDSNTGISFGTDTVSINTGGTARATVNSSGRLGIGTTSPTQNLDIASGYANISGLRVGGDNNQSIKMASGELGIATGSANPIKFQINDTERARIDSSGRLLVGTSSNLYGGCIFQADSGSNTALFRTSSSGNDPVAIWNSATTSNNVFTSFYTETSITTRGSIDYNRTAGQVRYNVTSDRRLKSDIQPAGTALADLSAIQVRSYKWTETDYQVAYGFIAQELNEVVSDAVKAGDDGDEIIDVWAVDNAKLVPLLTKALQEAIAKIESQGAAIAALEARLTTLEGGTN